MAQPTIETDGVTFSLPLSQLQGDGQISFRARASLTPIGVRVYGILDYAPDLHLPPAVPR